MKKLSYFLLILLISTPLFSQINLREKNIKNYFFEYHFEGKESSKKLSNSLLSRLISEKKIKGLPTGEHYLMTALLSGYSHHKKTLDSLSKDGPEAFNDFKKEFNLFNNLFIWNQENDDFQLFFTDAVKNKVERMTVEWQAVYYTIAANYLVIKKDYDSALGQVNRLISILENQTSFEPVQAYRVKGGINYYTGHRDIAMQSYEKSYNMAIDEPEIDSKLLTSLAWNLGTFYYSNSNYEKSIPLLEQSAKHYEIANGNSPYLISRYALLADVYLATWNIKRAEANALKAKNLAENIIKTDDPYLNGLVASSLCRIYAAQGKYDEGRDIIKPAIKNTIAAYGRGSSLAAAFNSDYAELESTAGNFNEAEAAFNTAVEMAYETDKVYTKTAALSTIINFYNTANKPKKALKFIEDERALLKANHDTLSTIYVANVIKKLNALVSLKHLDEATNELNLLTRLNKLSFVENEQLIHSKNAKFLWQLAMYKKTNNNEYLKNAQNDFDSFLKLLIQDKGELSSQNSKLFYGELVSQMIEPVLEISTILYKISPSIELETFLLRYFEVNKSSTLLNGLKDIGLTEKFSISSEILNKRTTVNDTLNSLQDALNKIDEKENERKMKLVDTQVKFQKIQDSIQQILKKEYPSYYNASTLQLSMKLSYYQGNVITNDEVLIEFYESKSSLYRLTIFKDKMNVTVVDTPSNFDKKLINLYDVLKNNKVFSKKLKEISSILLPKIPQGIKRITIVADGNLNKIPFEILEYENQMLIKNYTIRYAGSLQLLDEQIKLSEKEVKDKWGGYAPQYSSNTLTNNIDEVLNIQKFMKGDIVVGANATKENFINTSHNFGILHLAAHGLLDEINPMSNSLLFSSVDTAGDAALTTQEIYGLNINAQLAVLSACNTGSGKYEKGDGVMSMSRAFTFAGVSSTVMSLWEVPDKETAQLLELFYKNLKKGYHKDVALQQAKLTYLKTTEDASLKHPFYWAGFVLSGDVSPITSNFNWWWLALGIGLFLLTLLVIKQSKKRSIL